MRPMTRCLVGFVIALLTLGGPADAGATEVSGVIKVTGEYDSNPDRVVGGAASPDGVTALFSSVDLRAAAGDGGLVSARGQLGGRIHGQATRRDELVAALDLRWRHYTRGAVFFGLGASARDRVERTSTWDYTSLLARAEVGVDAGVVRISAEPTASRFVYRPVPDLDRVSGAGRLRLDVFASDAVVVSTFGGVERRRYAGERCCDDDYGRLAIDTSRRVDRLSHGGASFAVSTPAVRLELGSSVWRNASNASSRGWTRVRGDAALTLAPVGDLVTRVGLVVQRTRFDGDVLIDEDLAIDDDNRNRLSITADHPIGHPDWFVEASARHLIEDFGAGASFSRTIVALGVAWRPSTR